MRVLVLGHAKSGTTALHRSVCDALGVTPDPEWFEPEDLAELDLGGRDVVVKKLIGNLGLREEATFDAFDKRLMIVRDPRDRLISWLLYDIYGRPGAAAGARFQNFLEVLRAKEGDPASITVQRLTHTYWSVTGIDVLSFLVRSSDQLRRFWNRRSDQFELVRYENLVEGELHGAARYLGVSSLEQADVSADYGRVVRTKGSGDWRHWFTARDLQWLRPMTTDLLHQFGYTVDWELATDPYIDPAVASQYVERLALASLADRGLAHRAEAESTAVEDRGGQGSGSALS